RKSAPTFRRSDDPSDHTLAAPTLLPASPRSPSSVARPKRAPSAPHRAAPDPATLSGPRAGDLASALGQVQPHQRGQLVCPGKRERASGPPRIPYDSSRDLIVQLSLSLGA